jgi:hypothetical protein
MNKSVIVAGAVALLVTLSAANAAVVTGRIKVIDDADHRVVLTNGQVFTFANIPGAPDFSGFDDGFAPGERVRIMHNGGTVTAITPLN